MQEWSVEGWGGRGQEKGREEKGKGKGQVVTETFLGRVSETSLSS